MVKWYVWIDGEYHITRTNITGGQCECGKRLVKGRELLAILPSQKMACAACQLRYKPDPIGGPMSLPHYLEAENKRLREIIDETATALEMHALHKSAQLLRKKVEEVGNASAS